MRSRRGFGKVRRLPSKRWQASYVWAAGGPRYLAPVTFDSSLDAEAWLTDERRLISAFTWQPPHARKAAYVAPTLFRAYATGLLVF